MKWGTSPAETLPRCGVGEAVTGGGSGLSQSRGVRGCELRCHSESRGAGGGFADLFPNPRREAA